MCAHVCVWHYSISLTEFKTDVELTIWSPPALAELSGWNLGCSSQPNVQPRISRPFSDINRTPWKFGKCCCISVQLEKPKHMKQSGFVQHRTRWIMESISLSSLTRPLDGDTSNQICEKCRYLWKYISQWFLKDLPAKVQTFFPLEESLTMSQIWTVVWEGFFGLVTGYEEQLLDLLILSCLRLQSTLSPMLGRSTAEWFGNSRYFAFYYTRVLCQLCKSQGAQRWPHLQQHFVQLQLSVHTL